MEMVIWRNDEVQEEAKRMFDRSRKPPEVSAGGKLTMNGHPLLRPSQVPWPTLRSQSENQTTSDPPQMEIIEVDEK